MTGFAKASNRSAHRGGRVERDANSHLNPTFGPFPHGDISPNEVSSEF